MDIKDARIIYMGTPSISAKTFEALIESGVNFVALIAQSDKEVGRKKILEEVPTKVVAKKYHIPVYQPHKIKEDFAFIYDLKPDLILTFAYGQIIPHDLLIIPKCGCVNLHGSLLPKYRGAAPIQRAIMNGENKTGVTLMKMVDQMDAGKMYAKEEIDILPSDNYTSLADKISRAATKVALTNLNQLLNKTLIGIKQNENEVTFANKITPEEEHLNLNLSQVEQINYIRALALTPGAYLFLNNEKLKIYEAKIYDQAKDGLIELIKIKPQGKNFMNASDYVNGHKDIVGQILK